MHRGLSILLAGVALLVALTGVRALREAAVTADDDTVYLLLAENPRLAAAGEQVLAAYAAVLAEEGIPWQRVDLFRLLDRDAARLASRCPALVLPEIVAANGLTPMTHWLRAYMNAGGRVLLVYDAGSRDEQGNLRTNRGLRELLPLAVMADDPTDRRRFGLGAVRFLTADAADEFSVVPGKLDGDLRLTGYGFGALEYPLALLPLAAGHEDQVEVMAWGENAEGLGAPVLVERAFGRGGLTYVGLPLGYLKGEADDLLLRLVLRHLADRRASVPRVLPTPRGVGGLVLNWHVDGNADLVALPRLARAGLLDPELPASWHVTAGPDNDEPGDGLGFDACGRGRPVLDLLPAGSELGSHGGWAHNHFAREAVAGRFTADEMRTLIVQNRDCLARIAGRPLREYSSPAGVHPQPLLTGIIAELGFTCYYYTGDGGSAPNRTFYDGRPVSHELIAFPVLSLQRWASPGEIIKDPAGSPRQLAGWLDAVARYCARERTVRLIYAHPYDLFDGPEATAYREVWRIWQEQLRSLQADGRLQVRTMGDFAAFLGRCWRTEAVFRRVAGGLHVSLHNPDGLLDITVAVPSEGLAPPDSPRVSVLAEADRYLLTVEDAGHALDLLLPAR